jgi:hypothetical protein
MARDTWSRKPTHSFAYKRSRSLRPLRFPTMLTQHLTASCPPFSSFAQITAVQNYVDNPSETHQVHLNAQVLSLASYYDGFDVQDFYVETVDRRTAQCRSTGDPHYITFDGLVSECMPNACVCGGVAAGAWW